jgi:hypothetical protein
MANESNPLWPQGFDPANIETLADGLLHKRWLRVGNETGEMDAIDGEDADISALTRGAGVHPLYNGVAWVMVTGLARPEVDSVDGIVSITAPGFSAQFSNATSQRKGQQITVTLQYASD